MNSGCRLCGSNIMLLNIFELPIQESEQLRKCVELATGLSIHREDEMGKLVCKPCCDVAILCFKYRRNAQKNAIRLRAEVLELKANIHESPSTSTSTISTYISPSTSTILLRYPSLIIPTELYTKNITPVVKLQDIRTQPSYKSKSDSHVELNQSPKRYRITKMNTTKLCLKKLEAHPQNTHIHKENYTSDALDADVANISDKSNALHNGSPSKGSESDKSLLVPITSRDQLMCNMCNKTFKGTPKLNTHLQKHHKIIKARKIPYNTKTVKTKPKRQGKKRRSPKNLILKLVPLEQDGEIKRNYPSLFTNNRLNVRHSISHCISTDANGDYIEVSDTDDDVFKSQWQRGPTRHEKQLIEKSMLSVLETHMVKRSLEIKSALSKDAGVQAATQLDEKYILDIMGPNEMDIVSPDLSIYKVPVSLLKQSHLKDTTAFFIQYSATSDESKPIDWSKLKTIDLHRQIRQTSTPLNSTESHSDLFVNSLPSTIS